MRIYCCKAEGECQSHGNGGCRNGLSALEQINGAHTTGQVSPVEVRQPLAVNPQISAV